jgi:hypothetical protein
MKQIVLSVSAIFLVIGVVIAVFAICGPVSGQESLDRALRDSCYEALDRAIRDDLTDSEMIILMQRLFFGVYGTESDDSGIWFEIREADVKKGILSARVETSYTAANGSIKEISSDAAVILEQEAPKQTMTVRYYVSAEKAKELGLPYVFGQNSLYQEFVVEKGFDLPEPAGIEKEDIIETKID